jgi:hypothetical protein
LSRTGKSSRVHPLDEEVKNEQNGPQKKEDERGINVPPGEPAKRANKLRRHSLEPGLFAHTVKRSDHRIPRKAAPESPKLIMYVNATYPSTVKSPIAGPAPQYMVPRRRPTHIQLDVKKSLKVTHPRESWSAGRFQIPSAPPAWPPALRRRPSGSAKPCQWATWSK